MMIQNVNSKAINSIKLFTNNVKTIMKVWKYCLIRKKRYYNRIFSCSFLIQRPLCPLLKKRMKNIQVLNNYVFLLKLSSTVFWYLLNWVVKCETMYIDGARDVYLQILLPYILVQTSKSYLSTPCLDSPLKNQSKIKEDTLYSLTTSCLKCVNF